MIDPRLKELLTRISFIDRLREVYKKFPYTGGEIIKADLKLVKEFLNSKGYVCKFVSKGSFFNVFSDEGFKCNVFINFTIKYGVLQFILNIKFDGEEKGTGGPFTALSTRVGAEKRIPDPRFYSMPELNDALIDLLKIYDDIVADVVNQS